MMRRRYRRKVKKRFFVILALLIVAILSIFVVGNLINNKSKTLDTPDAIQPEDTLGPDEDGEFIICIDPGHGGYDNGTTSRDGVAEKDINLKVALKLGQILEGNDFKIVYTRKTDEIKGSTEKEDLKIRTDFSNSSKADIFISLHCNFDKVSTKTQGTEVWCRFPKEKGETLAASIQKRLKEVGYTKDRGLKYESDGALYVLKNTKAVAVLVEMGFLSNTEDCNFLKSDNGQDECAQAIAQAVLDYTGGGNNT